MNHRNQVSKNCFPVVMAIINYIKADKNLGDLFYTEECLKQAAMRIKHWQNNPAVLALIIGEVCI